MRVIRACRDMGLATVAVFSECDRAARHVRMADEAVAIGPSPPAESYLRIERIIDAARVAGADAIHPGYGFLSENENFAAACRDAGLTFIGPTPEAIHEAQRTRMLEDVAYLLGRHFGKEAIERVTSVVNELFDQDWADRERFGELQPSEHIPAARNKHLH